MHNAFSPYGDISSVGLLTVPPNDDPLGVCYAEMAREDHFSAVLGERRPDIYRRFPRPASMSRVALLAGVRESTVEATRDKLGPNVGKPTGAPSPG